MEIAIIGYGKMGKEIEAAALARGHEITAKYDDSKALAAASIGRSVAIDFSDSAAFSNNYQLLAAKFRTVIVGTTGWENIQQQVFEHFKSQNRTLIYGSNFSLGVNVFFEITKTAAKLLANIGSYDPYLLEMHHQQKKDAPSGTAKTLATILARYFSKSVTPASIRCGAIKGVHEIGFESEVDHIILKHEAYTRKGFADGAIKAAEWAGDFRGIWNFSDIIKAKFEEMLK